MKSLTRRSLTAAGIISAVNAGLVALGMKGCSTADKDESFDPDRNENVDVYGPPPEDYEDDYDPNENIVPAVYGPPPEDLDDGFNPANNETDIVYGPPSWFK